MMGMERICLEADFDQATMPRPTIEQSNIPCGLQGEATSLMTSATMLRCDKNSQENTHTNTHTHTHTHTHTRSAVIARWKQNSTSTSLCLLPLERNTRSRPRGFDIAAHAQRQGESINATGWRARCRVFIDMF